MSVNNENNQTEDLEISENRFPVVGVGASAGGLGAFKEFIQAIPKDSNIAYVLVQHLDPNQESSLPHLLQSHSAIPVEKIEDQVIVEPNKIYVIPSNTMLSANGTKLVLSVRNDRKTGGKNMSVDEFFRSLARVHESYSIGVVLTGYGFDGTEGLKAIKEQGGITFAQTAESTEQNSMPYSAIEEGWVDFILSPGEIPLKIVEIVQHIFKDVGAGKESDENMYRVYKQILTLLRARKGTDFTFYKQSTIRRRILRRMALSNQKDPAEYLQYLQENVQEQDTLHKSMLIPVTDFFRDEDIFRVLCEQVFPEVVKKKDKKQPIRIWVAGCSTGQEAYSMAMCLTEFLEDQKIEEQVQIFGTDLSEDSITAARIGLFSKKEIESLNPRRVKRFFTKVDKEFQVNKELREMCVFASHNFLQDPPFGKMDIVSCRNVLIYLQPYLQRKALSNFHYAIGHEGFLVLGKSETTSNASELFTTSAKHPKIFIPKDRPARFMHRAGQPSKKSPKNFGIKIQPGTARTDFRRRADDVILSRYTPAGVVVDENMDIVHFRGRTGNYLEPQAGKPDVNLLKMAKPGLAFELRSLFHRVQKEKETVLKENIPVEDNDSQRIISVEAIPLTNLADPYFLFLFHNSLVYPGKLSTFKRERPVTTHEATGDEKDLLIGQLKKELAQVRENMRSITEDQEATNEELQSANEELQSGSEEMQTLIEELETSKEELQSTNEELTGLNQELVSMNKNMLTARNFAVDILGTVREPWVVIDKDLKVKNGNSVFYKVFRTSEAEMENRSILDLGQRQRDKPELEKRLKRVLSNQETISGYEITQDFPDIGQRTMVINAREVVREEGGEKLILLVFGDITDKRMAEKSLEKSEIKFGLLTETLPQLIWITDPEGEFEYFNSKWKHFTGKSPLEQEGNPWTSFVCPDDLTKVMESWNRSLNSGEPFSVEYRLKGKDGIYNWFLGKALPLYNTDGEIIKWFGSNTNIQLQKEAEKALLKSREEFKDLAELIPEKVSYADALGRGEYYNKSWLQYTGLELETLKNTGWIRIVHPEERRKVVDRWKKSFTTSSNFEVETRILNRKGEYKWHLMRAVPIKDETEQVKKWIAATTEIEKIKEEEKRKEGFLQLVSHELKTPVTSIKGYVQLLLSLLEQGQNKSMGSMPLETSLKRIDDQVSRLTRLIAEMLDLSRIEDNRLELKKTDFSINELVIETVQDINTTEIDHDIRVEQDIDCVITADRDRIGQVLINFITNAIKYSPNGKKVVVKIFRPEEGKVGISVKDEGIGISKADQKEIFKRFHRVAGKNEETYAGLGIGLFLANEIIERHGGSILVESKAGEGSVFTFVIPTECLENN